MKNCKLADPTCTIIVGGCCAPNRYKPSGFLYQDDGSTFEFTGNKIMAISNLPMMQSINVAGWYMKKFVDNRAVVSDENDIVRVTFLITIDRI